MISKEFPNYKYLQRVPFHILIHILIEIDFDKSYRLHQ